MELVKVYNFHTFESVGSQTSEKKNPTVQNHEEKSLKLVQLLFAACNGDKLALERAYLSGLDMNMGDYDNRTALHLACAENHPACVKFLIETCKVDIDVHFKYDFPSVCLFCMALCANLECNIHFHLEFKSLMISNLV